MGGSLWLRYIRGIGIGIGFGIDGAECPCKAILGEHKWCEIAGTLCVLATTQTHEKYPFGAGIWPFLSHSLLGFLIFLDLPALSSKYGLVSLSLSLSLQVIAVQAILWWEKLEAEKKIFFFFPLEIVLFFGFFFSSIYS